MFLHLRYSLLIVCLVQLLLLSTASSQTTDSVTDIDGNRYSTVEIAGMRWIAENLRTTRYCNGDTIYHAAQGGTIRMSAGRIWGLQPEGVWCYYDDSPSIRDVHRQMAELNAYYGKLYNWYAVNDERNICPCGWHTPTAAEWARLDEALGGGRQTGIAVKSNHDGFWQHPDETDTGQSGFEVIPSGRRQTNGSFEGFGISAFWWSADENHRNRSQGIFAQFRHDPTADMLHSFGQGTSMPKTSGAAVRCVEDYPGQIGPIPVSKIDEATTTQVEDIDGNRYGTIIIGKLEWMDRDVQTTRFSNGDPIPMITDGAQWRGVEGPAYVSLDPIAVEIEIEGELWPLKDVKVIPPVRGNPEFVFTPNKEQPEHAIAIWEALAMQWEVAPEEVRFYNGYVALDERGVCPTGWRLPSQREFRDLIDAVGGNLVGSRGLREEVDGFFKSFPGSRSITGAYMFPGMFVSFWTGTTAWGGESLNAFSFSSNGASVNAYNTHFNPGNSIRCVREVEQSNRTRR